MSLRLMIFDNTDVKRTWTPDLNNDGDPDLGPDFQIALNLGLSHSWFAGGALFKALRRLDACRGFDNWTEALTWVANYRPKAADDALAPSPSDARDDRISEIQYWGHGSPGFVWMKREALTHYSPTADSAVGHALRQIASRLTPDALIWFRTCSTFAGENGHRFAKAWAGGMKCRVAAHTHVIGPFQSGLHSIRPGEHPSWNASEGLKTSAPATGKHLKWSSPWAPNTVTCLHSSFPSSW